MLGFNKNLLENLMFLTFPHKHKKNVCETGLTTIKKFLDYFGIAGNNVLIYRVAKTRQSS